MQSIKVRFHYKYIRPVRQSPPSFIASRSVTVKYDSFEVFVESSVECIVVVQNPQLYNHFVYSIFAVRCKFDNQMLE